VKRAKVDLALGPQQGDVIEPARLSEMSPVSGAKVTDRTLAAVDRALAWHEARAKAREKQA
jgi:hypothetical protein